MPIPSIQYDDQIEQGADWELEILDQDADEVPTDLTGCTAQMKVWELGNPNALRLTLTSAEGGGITIEAATGIVRCRITAAQSATLRSNAWYRLSLTWGDGEVNWYARGHLTLIPEVPGV